MLQIYLQLVYDRYSFSIGQYIGFADKEIDVSVSLSVLANTDFHIGN